MSNVVALRRAAPRRAADRTDSRRDSLDTVTRNLRLDALAMRHAVDALVVVEVGGSMLDSSGDLITCRALAAFAASRTTHVPGISSDSGGADAHLHCGRVCVSRQTIYGREVLIAMIGRRRVECTSALISGVIAAVVEANDRLDADVSGTFRVVDASA